MKPDDQIAAHRATEHEDILKLRSLSMEERGRLIVQACEAAAAIQRSRRTAGLPEIEPDPWPESTWDFLRKHAARD
ncbi:MAG: hypothetical protein JW818_20895 [Pirellulales bacterium]|nr:hypothetical protein [Pirellulales bacterium]